MGTFESERVRPYLLKTLREGQAMVSFFVRLYIRLYN